MAANMKRTLNLLYSGAKNLMNNNAVEKMDATPNVQAKTSSHSTLHQMRLAAKPEATTSCITCRTVTSLIRPPCNYCECELCDSCARVCHFCGGSFCQKCSLTVYLQDEKTVCLSCC
nr:uncharacterized protein LOC128699508 [Cherax quadricarinatus]